MDFLNTNRKILIIILSASIRGEDIKQLYYPDIDWETVFYEANQHQVLPLIYPLLSKIGGTMGVPRTLLEKLCKSALCIGMNQERNYIETGKILKGFTNSNIPVIVLKGLVLRDLYPYPSLRTMGDIDLLLKPDYMDRAERMLVEAGYEIYLDKGKHAEFSHRILPYVELHRSMAPGDRFEKYTDFETQVWERAVTVKVSGVSVLSLCPQDKVLYLTMHMASHILSSGFGLRQLCDFVLLIETYRNEIDWKELFRMAALCHIDTFVKVLLEGCQVLFGLELPKEYQEYEQQDISLVRKFIEDIFDGGVFGKNSNDRITANRLLYYNGGIMSLLFPKVSKLDTRYQYARSHRLLLPIAWIHRIFYIFVRKDINLEEKTAVFTSSVSADICGNRGALLRKLGLLD